MNPEPAEDEFFSPFAPSPLEQEIEKHLALGRNWMALGQSARAVESFRAALSLDPSNPFAHAQMALALIGVQRFDAARHEATLALEGGPSFGFFHYVAGFVEWRDDKLKPARAFFEQAIELDPEEADFHTALAGVWLDLRKFAEAQSCAREALALEPDEAQAHLILGLALLDQGRKDEAKFHFERAVQLEPQSDSVHHGAALFFLKTGDIERARAHCREALRLDPEDKQARNTWVQILGARNWFYGAFWKWSLALSRLPQWGRIAVIFGLWLTMRLLDFFGDAHPQWKGAVSVVGFVYLAFCVYTWTAPGLFNWYLRRSNQI